MSKDARVHVRLTKETAEEIRHLATASFRTFNDEMRYLLATGLEQEKREQKQKALRNPGGAK